MYFIPNFFRALAFKLSSAYVRITLVSPLCNSLELMHTGRKTMTEMFLSGIVKRGLAQGLI